MSRQGQRGLSIVEVLVGSAVGLFVVAGAAVLTSTQLSENRKLMLEAQIQQDLRATADIVSREIRRSGSWFNASNGVWVSDGVTTLRNTLTGVTSTSGTSGQIDYRYDRFSAIQGQSGYRLSGDRVQTLLPSGGWQDLSDNKTLKITRFEVTPRPAVEPSPGGGAPAKLPCPRLCPDTTTNCWPSLVVREFQIDLEGQSASDAQVRRSIRTIVRLRNDELQSFVPDVCPS